MSAGWKSSLVAIVGLLASACATGCNDEYVWVDPLATPPERIGQDLAINRVYYAENQSAEDLATSRAPFEPRTHVSISGETFLINGRPTYEGRVWEGRRIEGLLLNSRMVQAVFDDINPETRDGWAYPDTGVWDPERNTDEFIAAMPSWRDAGLLGISVNLQGGNAHSENEEWINTAFGPDGELHSSYFTRLRRVLQAADENGLVVILGLFYFRHDAALADEAAVIAAVDNTVEWLHDVGARNVLIEIANECDIWSYDHDIIKCERVTELVDRVRDNVRDGYRFPVSVSLQGRMVPSDEIIARSDFVLLHGNAVEDPTFISTMIEETRSSDSWRPMPIVFNEDDHYDFDAEDNNFLRAVSGYASWGFFVRRWPDDPMSVGYQSVPVDWTISSPLKRDFFDLVRAMTGGAAAPDQPVE